MEYKIGMLLGRLANGFQSDHGKNSHAVVRKMVKRGKCSYSDWGRDETKANEHIERSVALCGAKPGRRSVGWDFENYSEHIRTEVTCLRCLEKLKRSLK